MPFESIIQGILHGAQLGAQMRQQDLAREAQMRMWEQKKQDTEADNRRADAKMQFEILQNGGRRVNREEQVSEPVMFDGNPIPGVIGGELLGGYQAGERMRKANPNSTIEYGGQKYEIPDLDELDRRRMNTYDARQESIARFRQQVQDAKDANDMVDVPEDIAKALKIKPGPVSGKTLDRITRTHDMLERLRQRADQAQHPAVKFSSTGIDRDTGEILKTITFADGSTRTEATGSYDKNYVAADKRIAERRAPTGRGTDGGQAGGQAGGKARGGRPLTPAQLADALTERAIREDTSGDIQNAIRNVDKFYQDDEDFQRPGIRLMVKGRLQKMARDPKYLDREKEERKRRLKAKAEGEPGNSGSSGSKTGKGLTASDYLNQLSKEE